MKQRTRAELRSAAKQILQGVTEEIIRMSILERTTEGTAYRGSDSSSDDNVRVVASSRSSTLYISHK